MKSKQFLLVVVAIGILSFSVDAQLPADILGTIENGRYTNKFLKFELNYPDGWLVVETEERKAVTEIGSAAIKTGNSRADSLIAEGSKNEVVVLFVAEKPLGSLDNGVFGMSITKLPVKGYTPKFLTETFKSTFLTNPKNKLVKDVSIQTIGGRSWGNVLIDLDVFGQAVHTNYFVTVIDDYAVVATMSYQSPKHLEKMDAAFRGIRFSK